MITKNLIKNQLSEIGIKQGDVLFLAADLLHVGFFISDRETTLKTWVEILKEMVGDSGTLVIPAYTNYFIRYRKDQSCVFHQKTPSTSGSLSVAFGSHPGVLRSKHPTNSCYAIGQDAEYILSGHDEHSSSYLPYHRVIELGGKHLMLGCALNKNLSPMALHAAQDSLGITRRNWQHGLMQTYFLEQNGDRKLFTRYDFGGCSSFGYKVMGHHIVEKAMVFGKTGRAMSTVIDCKKSYDIFMDVYRTNPNFLKCDNKQCADCWGSPIVAHPIFWSKFFIKRFKQKLSVKFKG